MAVTTPTVPDEETPLLGGQRVSATKSKPAATLTDPSKRDPESKPNKKTSIPWPQFSILLLLQLVEPLTSQSIYPVSFPTGFLPHPFTLAGSTPAEVVCDDRVLNGPPFFISS